MGLGRGRPGGFPRGAGHINLRRPCTAQAHQQWHAPASNCKGAPKSQKLHQKTATAEVRFAILAATHHSRGLLLFPHVHAERTRRTTPSHEQSFAGYLCPCPCFLPAPHFVLLQVVFSAGMCVYFGCMIMRCHTQTQQDLHIAETMMNKIAVMDLEGAKGVASTTGCISLLESSLLQIVANLELYRPYLPDSLFEKVCPPAKAVVKGTWRSNPCRSPRPHFWQCHARPNYLYSPFPVAAHPSFPELPSLPHPFSNVFPFIFHSALHLPA